MPRKPIDIKGHVFGRITVIERDLNVISKNPHWRCLCVCGNEKTISGYNLISGTTKSCGCLNKEMAAKRLSTHGLTKRREYKTWINIKHRCYNQKSGSFKYYGARGIFMCDRWLNSFTAFYADMGDCPTGFSIDRINPNGHYEPANCRWADDGTQRNNKRTNRAVEYLGRTQNLAQWCKELNLNFGVISSRINRQKWPIEKAFTTPSRPIKARNEQSSIKEITLQGRTQTLRQWCKELGLNPNVISARIYTYKWDIEKAFTKPIGKRSKPQNPCADIA